MLIDFSHIAIRFQISIDLNLVLIGFNSILIDFDGFWTCFQVVSLGFKANADGSASTNTNTKTIISFKATTEIFGFYRFSWAANLEVVSILKRTVNCPRAGAI